MVGKTLMPSHCKRYHEVITNLKYIIKLLKFLLKVEEPLLDIFNYVAGIVPILSQHIEDVGIDQLCTQ